jgi:hypothetical protein
VESLYLKENDHYSSLFQFILFGRKKGIHSKNWKVRFLEQCFLCASLFLLINKSFSHSINKEDLHTSGETTLERGSDAVLAFFHSCFLWWYQLRRKYTHYVGDSWKSACHRVYNEPFIFVQ